MSLMSPIRYKSCCTCKKDKPISYFYKNKREKDGHHRQCKSCMSKYNRNDAHKQANKNYRTTDKCRSGHLKRRYGITIEQYDEMFEAQDGVCSLCGLPELGKRLAVDHDHTTGEVRSLLCQQCNCLIGFIENKNLDINEIKQYLRVK